MQALQTFRRRHLLHNTAVLRRKSIFHPNTTLQQFEVSLLFVPQRSRTIFVFQNNEKQRGTHLLLHEFRFSNLENRLRLALRCLDQRREQKTGGRSELGPRVDLQPGGT